MRICKRCKREKSLSEFYPHKREKGGISTICKSCDAERTKQWRQKNPIKILERSLNYYYGINFEQFSKMKEIQKGVCKICENPETTKSAKGKIRELCVDHDHKTGKVRGLLCSNCNNGLADFKDNPEFLAKAIIYLKASENE